MKFAARDNWGSSHWGALRNHAECTSGLSPQRREGWAIQPFRALTSILFWTSRAFKKGSQQKRHTTALEVGHRLLTQELGPTATAQVRGGPRGREEGDQRGLPERPNAMFQDHRHLWNYFLVGEGHSAIELSVSWGQHWIAGTKGDTTGCGQGGGCPHLYPHPLPYHSPSNLNEWLKDTNNSWWGRKSNFLWPRYFPQACPDLSMGLNHFPLGAPRPQAATTTHSEPCQDHSVPWSAHSSLSSVTSSLKPSWHAPFGRTNWSPRLDSS